MPSLDPFPRISRRGRLLLWVAFSLMLIVSAPFLCHFLADKSAALEPQVPRALQPPSTTEWFGTDSLGRSQWHRTLIACGVSLRVVAGALLIALPLSLVLGAIAGITNGRWPDLVVNWFIALMHTVPFFLLVVAVAALAGPGTGILPWLVGSVIWAPAARLVRAETVRILSSRFVRASRAFGAGPIQTFSRSLFPLTVAPAAVSLIYLVPEIIGIDAILTLFGLGPQPPVPSLGTLIFDGVKRWDSAPWLVGFPSLVLFAFCLASHYLADKIAQQARTTL